MPKSGSMIINSDGDIRLAISNGKYCITKGYASKDIIINKDTGICIIPIDITNMVLNAMAIVLTEGSTKTIGLTIEPATATNKTLNYTSSNENVATVDSNGIITAVSSGNTTITISTLDGSNINKIIKVMVVSSVNNCIQSDNTCILDEIKNGVKVNIAVNESKRYDFYVIEDTGTELTLIMDSNLYPEGNTTEPDVAWYADAQDNSKGPITALNTLIERTRDWTYIEEKEYKYVDDGGEINIKLFQKL